MVNPQQDPTQATKAAIAQQLEAARQIKQTAQEAIAKQKAAVREALQASKAAIREQMATAKQEAGELASQEITEARLVEEAIAKSAREVMVELEQKKQKVDRQAEQIHQIAATVQSKMALAIQQNKEEMTRAIRTIGATISWDIEPNESEEDGSSNAE